MIATMKIVPPDIPSMYEQFCDLAETVQDAWETAASRPELDVEPAMLIDAMSQLAGVLRAIEEAGEITHDMETRDLHTLTEYGQHLLADFTRLAAALGLHEEAREIEHLALPLAIWTARRGGEITTLAPVVNTFAYFANAQLQPESMPALFALSNEVLQAVSPAVCEDTDPDDPMRPWRLLILNRAIIATRSHLPELMELAFDSVVEQLPEDAERFFQEAMEQMDLMGYPKSVRDVVNRYYLAHAQPRVLH